MKKRAKAKAKKDKEKAKEAAESGDDTASEDTRADEAPEPAETTP